MGYLELATRCADDLTAPPSNFELLFDGEELSAFVLGLLDAIAEDLQEAIENAIEAGELLFPGDQMRLPLFLERKAA